jgi:uncharacterized protein (DUF488 family)
MTRLYTIGHSTRSIEDFLALLHANAIARLVDVRRYPGSRRFPHFGREPLKAALAETGIEYEHCDALGGRRPEHPDSPNTGLRDSGFRAYADYMETQEFRSAAQSLIQKAENMPIVIMCAEALWWHCHRSLISDYLKCAGTDVIHIGSAPENEPHSYSPAARVVDGRLNYRLDSCD